MTPPNKDPFDPAHVALRVVELASELEITRTALTNATQNMGSALRALQVDTRAIAQKMDNVTLLAARQETLDDEIERAFVAIKDLAETSREKWDQHHSAESTDRALRDQEIRSAREKLILWGGVGVGFSILAATLTAIVAWSVNTRFDNQSRDHDKLDARLDKHIEISAEDHKAAAERIDKIEKYLIRGGKNPDEPYDGGSQ